MPEEREVRRQRLRDELTARLRRVRGTMADADFARLVADVERVAARFAEIDAGPSHLERSERFG
jgi:hypothetical protein